MHRYVAEPDSRNQSLCQFLVNEPKLGQDDKSIAGRLRCATMSSANMGSNIDANLDRFLEVVADDILDVGIGQKQIERIGPLLFDPAKVTVQPD
ncbi:MAG: hypothetical protein A2W04_04115 [Betaproteobacteria bacterium RBG_16_64_9]|nr:MAG: hypothetical protein A2W04_04115 [Betaproteobacteria bacterium RBG_16_64_9]OGA92614.1 MAG: hypothetical protein A3G27_01740 [Betaproteobacteria bacterium RIFCSPLOWO2_12_FULL_66_14]